VAKDGTIFFTLDHALYSFAPDGTLLCSDDSAVEGVGSMPAIGPDGNVYVTTNASTLLAYAPDCARVWSVPLQGTLTPPTTWADGTIYVGSADGKPDSSAYGKLTAVTSAGAIKWQVTTPAFDWYPPTLGQDGTIYFGRSDYVYAWRPDGTMQWATPTGIPFNSSGRAGYSSLGPTGMIYFVDVTETSANVLLVLGPDGTSLWMDTTSSGNLPATGPDGTVYMPYGHPFHDCGVKALALDGTLLWETLTGECAEVLVTGNEVSYQASLALRTDNGMVLNYTMNVGPETAIAEDGTIYSAGLSSPSVVIAYGF
jgi:hypothetical protein